MKANELRIGNLINVTSTNKVFESFITDVKGYDIVRCEEKSFNYWSYEHIPLTEEWLLKFGFIKRYEDCFEYGKLILDNNFKMMDIDMDVTVNSVHQLQNLYFGLTGKELKLC